MKRYIIPSNRYEFKDLIPITFLDNGANILIHLDYLDILDDIYFHGQIIISEFEKILNHTLFNLDEELNAVNWESGQPIVIVLKASKTIQENIHSMDEFVKKLVECKSEVINCKNWFLLEAVQYLEIPGTKGDITSFGIQTRWYEF